MDLKLSKNVPIKSVSKTFQPKDINDLVDVHEKTNFGCHDTVKERTIELIKEFNKYCIIKAHAPAPLKAKTIPARPERIVPIIVEKKNFLNCICLDT